LITGFTDMSSQIQKIKDRVVGQALRLPILGSGRRSACPTIILSILIGAFVLALNCPAKEKPAPPGMAQVPTWSQDDLNFFLHGSMGTEVVPEVVLRAFHPRLSGFVPNSGSESSRFDSRFGVWLADRF
jgi:hypothetical protein